MFPNFVGSGVFAGSRNQQAADTTDEEADHQNEQGIEQGLRVFGNLWEVGPNECLKIEVLPDGFQSGTLQRSE